VKFNSTFIFNIKIHKNTNSTVKHWIKHLDWILTYFVNWHLGLISLWQVFFRETQLLADAHIHERTLTPMNADTHTLPIWAPPKNRVGPTNLEIDEGTTSASLSTGMSPTTERIMPLNPRINPGKCEHPCQVGELNPDGQVPPQGTQPAELRSVRSLWQLTFTGLLSFMCSTYISFFMNCLYIGLHQSWIH
jgi:hypothetical protein